MRSAWYVNWDKHAYISLKNNLKHLNMVLPEWFFINPKTDKVEYKFDRQALRLMRRAGIPILPMLTNNYKSNFHPEAIGRIMRDEKKRMALVNEMAETCKTLWLCGYQS